jgi:hypothetical protein
MSSELPLKADIAQYGRHVSKVPQAEMAGFIDHLIRWRHPFADTSRRSMTA